MYRFWVILSLIALVLLVFFNTKNSPIVPKASAPPREPIVYLYQDLADSLTRYFNRALEEDQIVGAAVAVVIEDSTVFSAGYGLKNYKMQDSIDVETIFRIGSVSKGFGGILAGIMVEKGLISWDEKVNDHIPDLHFGTEEQTQKVTIGHLLSHSTGLPYHSYTNLVEDGLPLSEIVDFFNDVKLVAEPGEMYSYQNAAFAFSGEIISLVNNKPISNVFHDEIFTPLNMQNTSVSHSGIVDSENVAFPHGKLRRGWNPLRIRDNYYNAIPAGGINSNITDMAEWLKLLMGYRPEIISPSMLKQVFRPRIANNARYKYYYRWPGFKKSHYGMGWRVHAFEKDTLQQMDTIIHHGGYVNNYRSEIAIYPSEKIGICVLLNGPTSFSSKCIPQIHAIVKQTVGFPKKDLLALHE